MFALYDAKSLAVSLRRSPDCTVDLSRLAAALGGGGHAAAAGCELPELRRVAGRGRRRRASRRSSGEARPHAPRARGPRPRPDDRLLPEARAPARRPRARRRRHAGRLARPSASDDPDFVLVLFEVPGEPPPGPSTLQHLGFAVASRERGRRGGRGRRADGILALEPTYARTDRRLLLHRRAIPTGTRWSSRTGSRSTRETFRPLSRHRGNPIASRGLACGPAQTLAPGQGQEELVAEKREPMDEVRTCPVCGERVNVYNLNVDPKGNVVGCAICGKNDPATGRPAATTRQVSVGRSALVETRGRRSLSLAFRNLYACPHPMTPPFPRASARTIRQQLGRTRRISPSPLSSSLLRRCRVHSAHRRRIHG